MKRIINVYVLLYDWMKGGCGNGMYRTNIAMLFFLFIISILLLSGCLYGEVSDQQKGPNEAENGKKKPLGTDIEKDDKKIIPLTISSGDFGDIVGWLTDDTVVYFTNSGQSSSVFTYNIHDGKNTTLYESDSLIVTVYISHSKEQLLIHSSPTSYEGIITVIDTIGNELATQSIISSEMTVTWNPFNEDLVLVSAFTIDWDFQVLLYNIKTKEIEELSLSQPFANWIEKEELIYLDWDSNTVSLFAPLIKQRIFEAKGKQQDFPNLYQLNTYGDLVVMISVNDEEKDKAQYTFLTKNLEPFQTLTIPHLTEFSDWLVPYQDVNLDSNLFFTLRPLYSGSADTYKDGFDLILYQMDSGVEEVLLSGLENKPISCSPKSEYCLYGFQFENIIDLNSKKIIELVKE